MSIRREDAGIAPGAPPLFIEEISSIVALNAGLGAVAVATMQE